MAETNPSRDSLKHFLDLTFSWPAHFICTAQILQHGIYHKIVQHSTSHHSTAQQTDTNCAAAASRWAADDGAAVSHPAASCRKPPSPSDQWRLAGWLVLEMAGQYSVPKLMRDSFGRLETSLCSVAKEMMYGINGILHLPIGSAFFP